MSNNVSKLDQTFTILENYSVTSNIVYKSVDTIDLSLDVYAPGTNLGEDPWVMYDERLKPTLIYFHGGGWVMGDRISRFLNLIPYLEKGWCVVNVDYRLLDKTDLEGCIIDCKDAIQWVFQNSSVYKFDTSRIFLSGESAGGHLALLLGLKYQYPGSIAGIINWYGITDIEKAVEFWNDESYTAQILQGVNNDIDSFYKQTSPITYVENDSPPVISIHGDADINVPVKQAIDLHNKLQDKGVKNSLIIIKDKKHGNFSQSELKTTFDNIWDFLMP